MADTIESLQIEIQSDSSKAISGIDALSASLGKLKTACSGGLGLTSVANQVKKLGEATQTIDGNTTSKIDALANSLSKLSSLGTLKISSSIGNQISKIGSAVAGLNVGDMSNIKKLADGLKPLETINKSAGLGTTLNQLKKIPEIGQALNNVNWSQFASQIQNLANALAPLATQLDKVGNGFSKLPANIARTSSAMNSMNASATGSRETFVDLYAKIRTAIGGVRQISHVVGSWINSANEYIEDMNLFTVSMGKYAESAHDYAEQVGELVGIDPAQWMRNQGVFNTIINGFGVASDKAALMSKNLTQLGYDISSFYNISVEDAMTKLQSGIAGELEPLRRLGYDLSVARLQEEALSLGIKEKVSDMNQAEKSQLRYYAIMTQVTAAQGDMARTLSAPANQLRILQSQVTLAARAFGNLFIPILNATLPYIIAVAKALRALADLIASFFGVKLPEVDWDAFSTGATAANDMADGVNNTDKGLKSAGKQAKKLKQYLLGIDELNVIAPDSDTGSGSGKSGGSGGGGGGDLGFDLPTYDFLDGLKAKNDEIFNALKKHLSDILGYAGAIATAFASWKIANGITKFIDYLKNLKGFSNVGGLAGLLSFLGDFVKMKRYLKDIADNGLNYYNGAGVISTFAGLLGDAFLTLGKLKTAGVLKIIQGIGEIIAAIADWKVNGFSPRVVVTALEGVADIITGIGLIKKNWAMVGVGLTLTGLLGIIQQSEEIVKGITTGDWSGVDKIALAMDAIEMLGGLVITIKSVNNKVNAVKLGAGLGLMFVGVSGILYQASDIMKAIKTGDWSGVDKIALAGSAISLIAGLCLTIASFKTAKGAIDTAGGAAAIGEAAGEIGQFVGHTKTITQTLTANETVFGDFRSRTVTATQTITETVPEIETTGKEVSTLTDKLKTLSKNLGYGLLIIGEVALAAMMIVGTIVILGKELEQVGIAWQPVIDNAKTVAIGLGTGGLLLAGVGTACGLLGKYGGVDVAKNIAVGTLVLEEITGATLLFVLDIWAIGKALTKIVDAWQPVIDNGDTVKKALAGGSLLLAAVGVATGALGAITIGSGGTVALAIGAGTLVLEEVTGATVLFIKDIQIIGKQLQKVVDAWNPVIEQKDTVVKAIKGGTSLLTKVGLATAALGAISIATFGALPLAIAAGTGVLEETAGATIKFIKQITRVGTQLQKIPGTWQPVLDNKATIVQAIKDGKSLLVKVGTATAALGGITIASAGTLPVAIGIGTKVLDEVFGAVKDFISKLSKLATQMNNQLAPALKELNGNLPTLTTNLKNFKTYMSNFAKASVSITKDTAISSFSATVSSIVDFFSADPIKTLSSNVKKTKEQAADLNSNLSPAVTELKTAYSLLTDYTGFLSKIENICGVSLSANLSKALFVDMKAAGESIGTGFSDGIASKSKDFSSAADSIINGFDDEVQRYYGTSKTYIETWADAVLKWFTDKVNYEAFGGYASQSVSGFQSTINSQYGTTEKPMTTWRNSVTDWYTTGDKGVNETKFGGYASNILTGFGTTITNNYDKQTHSGMSSWASKTNDWFTKDGKVNKSTFSTYGSNILTGFGTHISNNYAKQTQSPMTSWASALLTWFKGGKKSEGINKTTFEGIASTALNGFGGYITEKNWGTSTDNMKKFGKANISALEKANDGNHSNFKSSFEGIGKNVIQGFIDGVSSLWDTAMKKIKDFGASIIKKGKEGTDEHSPSKAFHQIGAFVIEGFNLGIESMVPESFKVMDDWLSQINSYTPTVGMNFAVDTSSASFAADNMDFMGVSTASVSKQTSVAVSGYKEGMAEFYSEYMQPMINQMADDIRRQADKPEQTIVQVGNKVVTDAVTTQKRANGYSFVSGG